MLLLSMEGPLSCYSKGYTPECFYQRRMANIGWHSDQQAADLVGMRCTHQLLQSSHNPSGSSCTSLPRWAHWWSQWGDSRILAGMLCMMPWRSSHCTVRHCSRRTKTCPGCTFQPDTRDTRPFPLRAVPTHSGRCDIPSVMLN